MFDEVIGHFDNGFFVDNAGIVAAHQVDDAADTPFTQGIGNRIKAIPTLSEFGGKAHFNFSLILGNSYRHLTAIGVTFNAALHDFHGKLVDIAQIGMMMVEVVMLSTRQPR